MKINIKIPEKFKEAEKKYLEVEKKIHVGRKTGADMTISFWNLQFAKNRLKYAKVTGSKQDFDKFQQELNETEKKINSDLQKNIENKSKKVNEEMQILRDLIKTGKQFINENKVLKAKFLYKQITTIYKKSNQKIKNAMLKECLNLRKEIEKVKK